MIVRLIAGTTCGSDLHLIGGYNLFMRSGDVIGHEFLGEVVEVGPGVRRHEVGDRVVVSSFVGCGRCWYCTHDLWSLCDNTNTNPGIGQALFGDDTAGIFGYSHVPEGVDDTSALFVSDSVPTGWMGADLGGVKPGDVVAVWGCGAVGQMAARAAILLGAERVISIDRVPERRRGPDVCIEAVGMEAHSDSPVHLYDQVKQQLRLQTDRPTAVRQAIHACRKGGTVFVLGVFGGAVDKFPLGAVINKGLTLRGAQQHGQRYIPMLLDRLAAGDLSTAYLATHSVSLDEAPLAYDMFKQKTDGCVRAVIRPNVRTAEPPPTTVFGPSAGGDPAAHDHSDREPPRATCAGDRARHGPGLRGRAGPAPRRISHDHGRVRRLHGGLGGGGTAARTPGAGPARAVGRGAHVRGHVPAQPVAEQGVGDQSAAGPLHPVRRSAGPGRTA